MKPIAVVPARIGSKRIPKKNLAPFLGVPLVQRVVTVLVDSGLFERVVVSTDSSEIAALAESTGAWVPRLRRAELADDFTPTAPVVLDAIGWVEADIGLEPSSVMVAYPTSVFLNTSLLLNLNQRFIVGDVEHVFLASDIGVPLGRTWVVDGATWEPYDTSTFFHRSQDLPRAYADTGQGYWSSPVAWRKLSSNEIPKSGAVLVDRWEAIDIDAPEDLRLAELVWRATREP